MSETESNDIPSAAERELPRVGITIGDPSGVGYEVTLKALDHPGMTEMFTPVVYASPKAAQAWRKVLGLPRPKEVGAAVTVESADESEPGKVNFIDIGEPADGAITPGEPSAESGRAALVALERGVRDLREGLIDVLVTAPIDKKTIQGPTFSFPGHTEYLEASLADESHPKALMIMADPAIGLRIALATTHLPIDKVAASITPELIASRLKEFDRALREDFAVHKPRIAVLALNPHAGDHGLLGSEEEDIITPAIEASGVLAFGPYSADGFFAHDAWRKFDGILAMYHDQGLIPFKALARDGGVNVTSGLPFVRTSPDHGTAYDIAGKNVADPNPMRAAIYTALDILGSRRRHAEHFANPLVVKPADADRRRKPANNVE